MRPKVYAQNTVSRLSAPENLFSIFSAYTGSSWLDRAVLSISDALFADRKDERTRFLSEVEGIEKAVEESKDRLEIEFSASFGAYPPLLLVFCRSIASDEAGVDSQARRGSPPEDEVIKEVRFTLSGTFDEVSERVLLLEDELRVEGLDCEREQRRLRNRQLITCINRNRLLEESLQKLENESELSAERYTHAVDRFYSVLENSPDAAFVIDDRRRVIYRNPLGRNLESDVGGSISNAISSLVRGERRSAYLSDAGVLQVKVFGEDRYFLPERISLGTKNGKGDELLTLRDITAIRLAEDLQSDLVGTISHEVKGPVTSVRMAVMLLLDQKIGQLNEVQSELVETARSEIERLLRMLNDLLDARYLTGGSSHLTKSSCEAALVLNRVKGEADSLAKQKDVTVRVQPGGSGEISIAIDEERIVHAVLNLVNNAIHYSRTGQEVLLEAVESPVFEEGIRIVVTDHGSGIVESDLQFIFNRYARGGNASGTGAGLGLSIVKDFVEIHGGEVGVESELGKGSRFFIDLPCASR